MSFGGIRFGRLGDDLRGRLLSDARADELTYDHQGSTLDPERWSAPEVRVRHLDVGRGASAFGAARHALRTWVPHAGIGARVEPPSQPPEEGATVVVVLRRGPLYLPAPNRIVAVIDEPRRFAFAYGTLPGHPERGEESFMVEHLAGSTVRATIRVQAVPATWAARAASPLVLRLQAVALGRYLRAIGAHVETSLS